MVEESDRLSRTVSRYLQFARGESTPAGTGDAAKALSETVALLEGECHARRVALERSGVGEGLNVSLDNESLKQLFLNLMLNALDSMPEGGTLTVTIDERRGRIEVGIADTGVGMAPETLKQVGQPFVTTKAQGSGLGLFLTQRLAQSAGDIWTFTARWDGAHVHGAVTAWRGLSADPGRRRRGQERRAHAHSSSDAGHDTAFVNGGLAALKRLEAEPFDAVITDLRMAPPDGLALLAAVRERWPATAVVLMTAYASMDTARRALREGAYDYVDKEGEFRDELKSILEKIARARALEGDNRRLQGTVESLKKGLATVVGESPALRQALSLAEKVAGTDSTVLLRGESGTGKDLFARAIHFSSRRAAGPWVKVNCGALPENLLESELFGHEKGSFTGAVRQKAGRFEDAHHGTLFLDEIGELSPALQVKLLQVIEEKTFTRVGGNQPITVDVRILAATNRDLEEMARTKQFREDLFFRLNVFPVRLPPLRERRGDIATLVAFILARQGASPDKVGAAALRALESYPFPGNVREHENTLERAIILAGSETIGPNISPSPGPNCRRTRRGLTASRTPRVPRIPPGALCWKVLSAGVDPQALELARGSKSQAARLLGLTRRTLYSRMEKHALRKPDDVDEAGEDDADADARAEGGSAANPHATGGRGASSRERER